MHTSRMAKRKEMKKIPRVGKDMEQSETRTTLVGVYIGTTTRNWQYL